MWIRARKFNRVGILAGGRGDLREIQDPKVSGLQARPSSDWGGAGMYPATADAATTAGLPRHPRQEERPVTAPSLAEETSRAYLAKTPLS
jgi:hypothetical protein